MKSLNIILGSTNKDKKIILQSTIEKSEISCRISTADSSSEVSEQPIGYEEIISGAKNRSKNCYNEIFDLSVGMEAGLIMIENVYNLVCATSLFDGSDFFVGISKPYALPEEVSNKIRGGGEFGFLIREFYKENRGEEILNLVSREPAFSKATRESLRKYIDHY